MEETLKRRFVFDTSALISLGSIKLIDKILDFSEIIVAPSVIDELENFAKHEDKYGLAAKEVLNYKGLFTIEIPKNTEKIEFIQKTDNELYNIAKANSIPLITDDIKLSRHLSNYIKTYFSTQFIIILVVSNHLHKEEALKLLDELKDIRNWRNNIIYLSTKNAIEKL